MLNRVSKWKPISQCKRTQTKDKKMELHCQGAVETLHSPAKLPTSLMSKLESLLCFSDCGLIQGVPKSYWCITIVVGKSQPRNPKKIDVKNVKLQETIVQM